MTASPVASLDAKRKEHALTGGRPTDVGNGKRLIARHGEDLRYHVKEKRWYLWDGTRWAVDETREIERLAMETVTAMFVEAARKNSDLRKELNKHAEKSESASGIRAMIERAGAEKGIPVVPGELDAHHLLFNCANGVVDLTTGDLKPHARELLMTKRSPAEYQETAACPRWLAFLDRVLAGDAELIAYVQRAIGYTLTGVTHEQCLHLLHGTGANGKSIFLDVFAALLGEYALTADFTTFLEQKHNDGPRADLARLNGARLVRSSEVGEGKRFNEARIKQLTGSEVISARFLYASEFEFKPTFKLWFAANHKPVIRGTDHAIWRRVRLIPFTVTIPDEERRPYEELLNELRDELSGILAWAVQGCLEWRANGLRPPESVMAATAAYRGESDVLGTFLEETCELAAGYATPGKELYEAYKKWAAIGGEFELSHIAFGRQLGERGLAVRKSMGLNLRCGIRLMSGDGTRTQELY